MLKEALNAILECDICVFVGVASISKTEINYYANFIKKYQKRHILVINKIDKLSKQELLECLNEYKKYQSHYIELFPMSAHSLDSNIKDSFLSCIAKNLPEHPHFYKDDIISTTFMRDIYKEAIREALFERLSDEIPYQSDVRILKIEDRENMIYIKAQIVVEKDSQKSIVIGKNGSTIKSLGIIARKKCEEIAQKKVFLELFTKTIAGWSKNANGLKQFGYDI